MLDARKLKWLQNRKASSFSFQNKSWNRWNFET